MEFAGAVHRIAEPRWLSWESRVYGELLCVRIRVAGSPFPWALFWLEVEELNRLLAKEAFAKMSKLINRLIDEKKAQTGSLIVAADSELEAIAPTVAELLTTQTKKEGVVYDPFGMFVYARQGSWFASLSQKRLGYSWRGEGGTIKEAVADLELRIKRGDESSAPPARGKHKVPRNGQEEQKP